MKTFDQQCYDLLMLVPSGKVTTYKAIADALNSKAYRAVWWAMNRNPDAPQVPCHRVVSSDWSLWGYAFGCDEKIKILKTEWIIIQERKWKMYVKDFESCQFIF